jgi:IclR family transcriptional regulator, KDG regulon repressor
MPDSDRQAGVRSLQLALDVLETVAFSAEELGVTQIAERVRVAKGSVHRHLLTLVERGYVTQNPVTSRYGIGAKSRLLARLAPDADLVRIAEGPMRELRDTLGHSVVFSAMTPRGALVMSTIPGTSPIEIGVRPGSELSFHASAQGKVLIAFAPRPVQERMLAKPLPALTPRTVVDRVSIDDELSRITKVGYATAPEQALLGVNAIAVPIFDQSDACVAAVALVGSVQFLPESLDSETIAALKLCGEQISRKLGHARGTTGVLAPGRPQVTRKAGWGVARKHAV